MPQAEPDTELPSPAPDQRQVPDGPAGPTEPAAPHPGDKHREQMQFGFQEIERSYELMRDTFEEVERSRSLRQQGAERRQKPYRIYLLDASGVAEAAEFFYAHNDDEAIEVAASVHEAASDTFQDYELWHGDGRIASDHQRRDGRPKRGFEDAIQCHQDTIVDLEERLQEAFACVKRSRKLFEIAAKLRRSE